MTRILFITHEFTVGTFSGNGVYASSQAKALSGLGHHVVVLCACPDDLVCPEQSFECIWVCMCCTGMTVPAGAHFLGAISSQAMRFTHIDPEYNRQPSSTLTRRRPVYLSYGSPVPC